MQEIKIRGPEDLRPGDVFFGPIGGLTGLGVGLGQLILGEGFRIGDLSIRHVAIVTGAGVQLAQSMPTGAELVSFHPAKHWSSECAYVRLPEDHPGQAGDAAAVALAMVNAGVRYSFASYPSLALYRAGVRHSRLLKWIGRRRPMTLDIPSTNLPGSRDLPVEAICSVFVDQAWTLAGKSVIDDPEQHPQAVTPGRLARTLLSFPGATWCLPLGEDRIARSWTIGS